MTSTTLAAYYADIAAIYDRIHDEPARQEELDELQEHVAELFDGHKVLELGCGTGFWTDTLSYVAESVVAVDSSPEMLALARGRLLDPAVVRFEQADALALPDIGGPFTACFAGSFWSHVKREEQDKFLKLLRSRLAKDALLVIVDENFVEDETAPVARTDLEGNTYHMIAGPSGQRHEVLRNYPADSSLRKRFASHAREVRIERLEHYWMLTCRLK